MDGQGRLQPHALAGILEAVRGADISATEKKYLRCLAVRTMAAGHTNEDSPQRGCRTLRLTLGDQTDEGILCAATRVASRGLGLVCKSLPIHAPASRSFGTALRTRVVRQRIQGVLVRGEPLAKVLGWIADAADAHRHLSVAVMEEAAESFAKAITHQPHPDTEQGGAIYGHSTLDEDLCSTCGSLSASSHPVDVCEATMDGDHQAETMVLRCDVADLQDRVVEVEHQLQHLSGLASHTILGLDLVLSRELMDRPIPPGVERFVLGEPDAEYQGNGGSQLGIDPPARSCIEIDIFDVDSASCDGMQGDGGSQLCTDPPARSSTGFDMKPVVVVEAGRPAWPTFWRPLRWRASVLRLSRSTWSSGLTPLQPLVSPLSAELIYQYPRFVTAGTQPTVDEHNVTGDCNALVALATNRELTARAPDENRQDARGYGGACMALTHPPFVASLTIAPRAVSSERWRLTARSGLSWRS